MTERLIVAWSCLALVVGCATGDLSVDTPEAGRGQVTAIETLPGAQVAIYGEGDPYDGLTFGRMDVDFVAIDQRTYVADWDDRPIYRSLTLGDRLSFGSTGRLIRVEGSGAKDGNYRQIRLRPNK